MNIYVSQIYPEVSANYPFTHLFQQYLSKLLSESTPQSSVFTRKYGDDFNLIFRMSAKSDIKKTEIKGPTVFKRDKDVEYTIFLPYRKGGGDSGELRETVTRLLAGIVDVLNELGFETTHISVNSDEWAKKIIRDQSMISS